jgi:signal peptidase
MNGVHGPATRWRALGWAVSALALVVWAALLRPQVLGGPASYIVVAGDSMQPALNSGDLAVALPSADYRIGDVVVFEVPPGEPGAGARIIHRIVAGSETEGFVTQGDNRDRPDFWRPRSSALLGAVRLVAPAGGTLLALGRSPAGLGVLAGFMFVVLGSAMPATAAPRLRLSRSDL